MMRIQSLLALTLLLPATSFAFIDPASVKINVYGMWVSTAADCTNPVKLFDNATATTMDFTKSPKIGGGNIPDGTYNCVIIKMDDLLKISPATDSGACVVGTEYSMDVCRAAQNQNDYYGTTEDLDGTVSDCVGTNQTGAGAISNVVYTYISTSGAASDANVFRRPGFLTNKGGLKMDAPFVVSGNTKGKFKFDFRGKVTGSGEGGNSTGVCVTEPGTMSFSKI